MSAREIMAGWKKKEEREEKRGITFEPVCGWARRRNGGGAVHLQFVQKKGGEGWFFRI